MNFFEAEDGSLINLDAINLIVPPGIHSSLPTVYFSGYDYVEISEKDFNELKQVSRKAEKTREGMK